MLAAWDKSNHNLEAPKDVIDIAAMRKEEPLIETIIETPNAEILVQPEIVKTDFNPRSRHGAKAKGFQETG